MTQDLILLFKTKLVILILRMIQMVLTYVFTAMMVVMVWMNMCAQMVECFTPYFQNLLNTQMGLMQNLEMVAICKLFMMAVLVLLSKQLTIIQLLNKVMQTGIQYLKRIMEAVHLQSIFIQTAVQEIFFLEKN